MLQTANIDLFKPLVFKVHNNDWQNLLFTLQFKPVRVNIKLNWRIFILGTLGTNGLRVKRNQENVKF